MLRRTFIASLAASAAAQSVHDHEAEALDSLSLPYVCPMDPDVRSDAPGPCRKCGMDLELGVVDRIEYPVRLKTTPAAVRPNSPVELAFEVLDPRSGERRREFRRVHEKLFHLLYVGHDLETFGHEHPVLGEDGLFRLTTTLPREGLYRLLADFYPDGGSPQMRPLTLVTAGFNRPAGRAALKLDPPGPKRAENLAVSLSSEPGRPLATFKTLLFFDLDSADGLEKFLGAWAHMLAASDDLTNLIHAHPAIADGGRRIQMNVIFPTPGMYRLWIQMQRRGVVNTVPFTVEVAGL